MDQGFTWKASRTPVQGTKHIGPFSEEMKLERPSEPHIDEATIWIQSELILGGRCPVT